MNFGKIALIIGLALSVVVGVGAAIPYAALALAILGLVSGCTDDSDQVTVLVTAVALSAVHGALGEVPAVGGHITNILGGVSTLINAAALAVIIKGIVARVKA